MALVAIPVVVAAAPPNPRVYLGERTGAGPWTWTGLNGDAAGLRGYEIVGRCTKVAAVAHTLGVQFNGDAAANYRDRTGGGLTSAPPIRSTLLGVANEVVAGRIEIPVAASGAFRIVNGFLGVTEGTPEALITPEGGAWTSTAAIASISLIVETGAVDAGTWALYAMMDVP